MLKSLWNLMAIAGLAIGFSSCVQPPTNIAIMRAAPAGTRFEGVGTVGLYSGQPCTSQIMFDFQIAGARSAVLLAAPMRETNVLTDAANQKRRVHIRGTWRRGQTKGCSYVNVTKVGD